VVINDAAKSAFHVSERDLRSSSSYEKPLRPATLRFLGIGDCPEIDGADRQRMASGGTLSKDFMLQDQANPNKCRQLPLAMLRC
jgi:hypothetical protein